MVVLRQALRIEVAILVAGFAIVLVWKILRAVVRWVQQKEARTALGDWVTGALRLQMPAASLLLSCLYLIRVRQSAGGGNLPPVPAYALVFLAGSQSLFLVVMARRLLRPFIKLTSEGEK